MTPEDSTILARFTADEARRAIEALTARVAELEAENARLLGCAAALAAAISLLERGGEKAAPSDKMLKQTLKDYKRALANFSAAL